jgi:hypothetical protein
MCRHACRSFELVCFIIGSCLITDPWWYCAGKYFNGSGASVCTDCPSETPRAPTGSISSSSCTTTGNRTMPAWGKSGYSHCQLLFSWTELIKVPSFIRCYPIVSTFFLFHPSCFIDDSLSVYSLKFVISLYFFCLYDVCHYIHHIRGPKSVKLCSGLVVSVDTCRKMFMRAGCA